MSDELKADLVLEGGGVKGIALVGALSVLADAGYSFPRVAGTSAGAIVGALVAADMSTSRMRTVMAETDYRRFQDTSLLDRLPGGRILSVLFEDGVYEGEYLRSFLAELLGDLDAFKAITLPDDPDSALPTDQRYRLVVMVSDVSLGRLVRFPWDYRPVYGLDPAEQKISDAVRASMSIPFFFEPAKLEYSRADGDRRRDAHSVLVDGGMLSNFPIDVFDRTDDRAPRWPTLGIKLSTRPGALAESFPKNVEGPVDLAKAMITTMTSFHDAMHVDRAAVQARTIFVDTLGVKATDFDIDAEMQERLFQQGVNAATAFLETWDFERYVADHR